MTTNDDDADDGPLTERERQFVVAYTTLCHGNAAEAARHAGYATAGAAKQGCRLLARPRVRAAIEAATEGDPLVATRTERLRWWTSVMRGALMPTEVEGEPEEVPLDPEALGGADAAPVKKTKTLLRTPELKDRLKASELLGKSAGDFVERVEHEFNPAQLTDEQLARIAAGEDPRTVVGGKR